MTGKGYLVLTAGDFTVKTFFDGFQKALCIADYYNTRVFAVSCSHGLPSGGFCAYNGFIDANVFAVSLYNPTLVSNSRLDALGLSYMKGKLNGGILEAVYYIASCFALGAYGLTAPASTNYHLPLLTYASMGTVFGVAYTIAKYSDVSRFLTYFLRYDRALASAYDDACWTVLYKIQNWGEFSSTYYKLPEM